jgi:hypothetical protein
MCGLTDKIKQSAAQVALATGRVGKFLETCPNFLFNQFYIQIKIEREAARRRQDAAGAKVIQAAKVLVDRRRELDDFRRATFESYAAQHPPPPSYDVVTSPASLPSGPSFPTPQVGPSHEPMDVDKSLPSLTQSPELQPFLPLGMPEPSIPQPSIPQPKILPSEWGSSESSCS